MPRFLAVHPVGNELTLETAAPLGKAVKAVLGPDAYWIRSSYAREEGKLYCEWDAVDASSIRRLLSRAAPALPTEGIYELELRTDAEEFR
jgi:hypothetical protein